MICPSCGAALDPGARACLGCGVAVPGPPPTPGAPPAGTAAAAAGGPRPSGAPPGETVLHRFGPFGVGICFGRPGVFARRMQNAVEVVLTDHRLCGVWEPSFLLRLLSRSRDPLYFNVPFAAVTAIEQVRFAAVHALWFQYATGGATREVAVEGAIWLQADIQRLYQLVWPLIPEAARAAAVERSRAGGT